MEINNFTFVAVVYNNYRDTLDFIESIEKLLESKINVTCVIVDNSDNLSVQNKIDDLVLIYPFVKILRPGSNLGYFGGFNHFFRSQLFDLRDIVILCNNDLVFYEDFIRKIKSKSYSEDIFIVCPDVITLDGVHQNPHVLKPRTTLQRLKLDLYFSNYYLACCLRLMQKVIYYFWGSNKRYVAGAPCYLHMGIGACYILLPNFISKFGTLDYPHFLYGEEAYLTRQVHTLGGRLYYDPDLKVSHKESATLSKLPKKVTYDFAQEGYWNYRKFY